MGSFRRWYDKQIHKINTKKEERKAKRATRQKKKEARKRALARQQLS